MTSSDVIMQLNTVLKNELTAINQYFLHARMLKHMGYIKFADAEYAESIEEMKHADIVMQRIFTLGGLPNLQDLGRMNIGETPVEIVHCDYKLEVQVVEDLRKAHAVCAELNDPTSLAMIEDIIAEEELHKVGLEAKIAQITAMGEQNFLQTLI